MLKNTSVLRSNSTLNKGSGLSRGKGYLNSPTRLKAKKGRSGRIIDGVPMWSLTEADQKIKEYIYKRDGNRCVVTGNKDFLTLSHYHRRDVYSVRFDPLNLITLNLWNHTIWETKEAKETEYRRFMIKHFGIKAFNQLNKKAMVKMSKEKSIVECMKFLGALPINK